MTDRRTEGLMAEVKGQGSMSGVLGSSASSTSPAPTPVCLQDDSAPRGLQMGITVLVLQNALFPGSCFPSQSPAPPPAP